MKISTALGLQARFKFVLHKASTGEISNELPWTRNIVLDSGLARMSQGHWVDRCMVGSGNTVPLPTDTSLTSFVASTTTITSITQQLNSTVEPYYTAYTVCFRFNEGVGTGTLREVGLGWTDDRAWNKALILDNDGNPTDLVKLADEFLDIYCQIRVYAQSSYSGTVKLYDKNGTELSTHTVTGLPVIIGGGLNFSRFGDGTYTTAGSGFTFYDGNIGTSLTSTPNGSYFDMSNITTTVTYPTTTSMLTTTVAGLDKLNGSIRSLFIKRKDTFGATYNMWDVSDGYKFQFDPPIVKNNTQKLQIRHLLTWGRFTG